MDELEKEIEALIASKKNKENKLPTKLEDSKLSKEESKSKFSKKDDILESIDDIIANAEKNAKKAKERIKNNSIDNESIKNIFLKKNTAADISKTDSSKPETSPEKKENYLLVPKVEKKNVVTEKINNILSEESKGSDKFISKRDIIGHLRLAKTGHKSWMANVQILIRSGNIDEAKSLIPVNFTSCKFGEWYYGEGQMLSHIEEYQNLEMPHQKIHDVYLQIFNLYKTKIEGSLFNSEKKQKKERERKAISLKKSLSSFADILFKNLLLLEDRVKKFNDEEMNDLNVF